MITSKQPIKAVIDSGQDICETKIYLTLENSVDKSITSGSVQLLVMLVLVLSRVAQRSTHHPSPGGSSTGALNQIGCFDRLGCVCLPGCVSVIKNYLVGALYSNMDL